MEVLTWVAEQEDKSKRIDVFVTEQIEQIERQEGAGSRPRLSHNDKKRWCA